MKGIVFTMLSDMVDETFGMEVWDDILDRVEPESNGVYTSGESYPDAELFALVGALSEMKAMPIPDLVRAFGEYSLSYFAKHYPVFFENTDAKQFLMSVENVIHVEVRKLYPHASLPTFEYEVPSEDKLIMHYRSPRRMFDFAEGLILGTAKHYATDIGIHRYPPKDDCCTFELTFKRTV